MFRFILFIIAGVIIILILGGYFLWWPEYQDFKAKKVELENKEEEIRQTEEHLMKLRATSDKLAGYTEEMEKIDIALPLEPSLPALFNFFLKKTSESGLILNSIGSGGISEAAEEKRIQEIPFSISLSGSYPAFKNFLSIIYKNTRLFEVNSISFSSPETEEGKEELFSFELSLKTHAYQEEKIEEAVIGPEGEGPPGL